MNLFNLNNLSYFYPSCQEPALNDISLDIKEGEFVLVVGPSGGGKTTLVRVLSGLIPHFYGGTIRGNVSFKEQSFLDLNKKDIRREIGIVFQNPEKQIIMGEVERDLALGLENLGVDLKTMMRRVTETLSYLNLAPLRNRLTHELSSGEKQKVAIGSILAMMPKVLIFDEPTSQLDPAASQEAFAIMERLHREHGFTIILIEQRLDYCLPLADRVLLIEEGRVVIDESPQEFSKKAVKNYSSYIPPVSRLFSQRKEEFVPLTVKEARPLLRNQKFDVHELIKESKADSKDVLMSVRGVHFSYSSQKDILNDIHFDVARGECVNILGENGAGKSTLLKCMSGIVKPAKGKILLENQDLYKFSQHERAQSIGYLSQNPNDYLFNDTVEQELLFTMNNLNIKDRSIIDDVLETLCIEQYRHSYPRNLSTGERQRVALASVLVAQPKLILLDEPTRGLDGNLKDHLGKTLKHLIRSKNISVVLITQDVEFAAEYADHVCLFSEGKLIDQGQSQDIFNGNLFYSTQINKLFDGIVDRVINYNQAEELLVKSNG